MYDQATEHTADLDLGVVFAHSLFRLAAVAVHVLQRALQFHHFLFGFLLGVRYFVTCRLRASQLVLHLAHL